jgi:hypothetical protein
MRLSQLFFLSVDHLLGVNTPACLPHSVPKLFSSIGPDKLRTPNKTFRWSLVLRPMAESPGHTD